MMHTRNRKTAHPTIEKLEDRRLLSASPAITNVVLVDAGKDQVVGKLDHGATIDVAKYPGGISVRADVNSAATSVKFGLGSNDKLRIENDSPYTIAGDAQPSDYWAWRPKLGWNLVKIKAFSKDGATGRSSPTKEIAIKVVNSAVSGGSTSKPTPSPTPSPAPAPSTGSTVTAKSPTNGNSAPSVSFINPTNNAEQAHPGNYVVRVNAHDSDGKIAKVEFFANGRMIDSTVDAPYSAAWTNVATGKYTLTARATDDDGAQKLSSITVTIKNPTRDQTFYVSTSGNDKNSGGSTSSAFRTIGKAASIAGAGDTVVILPGTYRESVGLKNSGTATAPITFKAQKPGTVFIDGADHMGGWSREGSSHVYSTKWDLDFFLNGYRYHGSVKETGYAEQFIYNNKALTQVTSRSSLSAGEFYVDWNANKVYVWLPDNADARKKTVMGSKRQTLMTSQSYQNAKYITIDGLNFRHAANFPQQPVVKTSDGWVVKNSKLELMNAVPLGIYGNNVLIQNNVMANNGHTGLTGQATNTLLVDNEVYGNNTRGFRATWESGGGKMTRTVGLYVLNHNTYNNRGPGFWLDIDNKEFVIDGGFFHDNRGINNDYEGCGLLIELNSGPGRVQNASFYGNTSSGGLGIAETPYMSIRGNYFGGGDRFELRNIANRPFSIKHVKIESNKFENSMIANANPNFDVNSFRKLNVTASHNVFDNASNIPWYYWRGVKYFSGSSIASALGVDKTASAGSVTIPKP
ncbi:MAG TPA: Ig-like domain-containing protein [Tepidisphaeraceae bacterium]|jgi:hypothetical protein|nr:Ig-like domain-containing protein [Tepidisphaeraceae bacterium]